MVVVIVAITIHIRYTRNITSTITIVQWGMDTVIKLNTHKLEAIKTYFMTRNNKVDMYTAAIAMTCN
jgi:hypothetical protein